MEAYAATLGQDYLISTRFMPPVEGDNRPMYDYTVVPTPPAVARAAQAAQRAEQGEEVSPRETQIFTLAGAGVTMEPGDCPDLKRALMDLVEGFIETADHVNDDGTLRDTENLEFAVFAKNLEDPSQNPENGIGEAMAAWLKHYKDDLELLRMELHASAQPVS
jgi:hypothetical protein